MQPRSSATRQPVLPSSLDRARRFYQRFWLVEARRNRSIGLPAQNRKNSAAYMHVNTVVHFFLLFKILCLSYLLHQDLKLSKLCGSMFLVSLYLLGFSICISCMGWVVSHNVSGRDLKLYGDDVMYTSFSIRHDWSPNGSISVRGIDSQLGFIQVLYGELVNLRCMPTSLEGDPPYYKYISLA